MLSRSTFFKPYRQKLLDMQQHHDSMQDEQKFSPLSKSQIQHSNYYQMNKHWGHNSPNALFVNSPLKQQKSRKKRKQNQFTKCKHHKQYGRQMHQPVWQYLYSQGLKTNKQIEEAHKQKQFRIDSQCTFQPLIKKNSRYRIPTTSNFLQRNYIWQQNKLQKIVKQKQQQVTKDLQQCTFKPKLNKYLKKNYSKFNYLQPSKSLTKLQNRHINQLQEIKNIKQKQYQKKKQIQNQGLSRQQVGKMKNLIRNELKRIQL